MKKTLALAAVAAVLISILAVSPALAHKVYVFAVKEGDALKGEAYFRGGSKVQNRPVELVDATGKLLASGETDDKGVFTLPMAQGQPPFTVVIKAGEGHQGEYKLTAADLGLNQAQPKAPAPAKAAPQVKPKGPAPAGVVVNGISAAELDHILAQRLAPMEAQIRRLAEQNEEVTLSQVVGGLGWILGLLGIAAWVHSRKRG